MSDLYLSLRWQDNDTGNWSTPIDVEVDKEACMLKFPRMGRYATRTYELVFTSRLNSIVSDFSEEVGP